MNARCRVLHDLFDPVWDLFPVDASQSNIRAARNDVCCGGRHLSSQSGRSDQPLSQRFRDSKEFRNGGTWSQLDGFGFGDRYGRPVRTVTTRRTTVLGDNSRR